MGEQSDSKDPHSINDVLDGLGELANSEDQVPFGDVLDKFGSHSFAPIMLVLALVELSPIGAIPVVPTILAVCIALVAGQLAFGSDHVWVPDLLERRSLSSGKIDTAVEKVSGIAAKLDSISTDRMTFLTKGAAVKIAAGLILLLCCTVPPLELLPWASSAPMLSIAVISLALMVRDGLVMLLAYIVAAAAIGGIAYWYFVAGGQNAGSGGLPI